MRKAIISKTAAVMLTAMAVLLFFVFPVRAEFRYTPITVFIPVEVKAEAGSDDYEIVIERLDDDAPMPVSDTMIFRGEGQSKVGIEIDEPGTYKYKIYERSGKNENIIYDDTTYTVTLFVTQDDDSNLQAEITLSKGGLVKPSSVRFANAVVNNASVDGSDSGDTGPKGKPGDVNLYVAATGEAVSKFAPYALAAFVISGAIFALALKRRKKAADE